MSPLTRDRYLEILATDLATIGRYCRAHPDGVVRTCPDWTGADLLAHLDAFTRWLVATFEGAAGADLPAVDRTDAVHDWDATARSLVDLLRAADPATPVPNWSTGEQTAGWWLRRSAHDVAVHRYDAATIAGGTPDPVPADVALDGIEEYLAAFVDTAIARGAAPPSEATLAFEVTDTGTTVTHDLPRPGEVTRLRGTASQLYLGVWHRIDPESLFVDGDRALVAAWPHV